MIWMNGRNRREGGLFLLPGLLFGGIFGIYVLLAVLNVAGIVIGTVFSGLAVLLSGVMSGAGSIFAGIGDIGGLVIGIALGLGLYYWIRSGKMQNPEK